MKVFRCWLVCLLAIAPWAGAQDVTVVQSASDAADGLDLKAVGELFKNSKDAAAFEKALNDPDQGVNNLDLDDNGEVDYIRVLDEVSGNTHVLVMQVQLSKTEYQDVATIEVEKSNDGNYNVQLHGNKQIYGVNYYVHPVGVNWASVAFVSWLYRPYYKPYRSPYYWGYYPRYWRPWRPLSLSVYRTRTVRITRTVNYRVSTKTRVVSAKKVYVAPKSSTLVRKPLKNPTSSQKKFQARSTTKTTAKGGFGKKTTTTKTKAVKTDKGTAAVRKTKTTGVKKGGGKATRKTKVTKTKANKSGKTKTKKTKKTTRTKKRR